MKNLLTLTALIIVISLWRILLKNRIQRGARPNKKLRIAFAFLFFPILIIPSLLGVLLIVLSFSSGVKIALLILGCLIEILGVLLIKYFWKWIMEGIKGETSLTV